MLGLRRHRGVAIDLFQGDVASFACDVVGPTWGAGGLEASLLDGDRQGCRHVVFPPSNTDGSRAPGELAAVAAQAAEALAAVKAFTEGQRSRRAVGRVTFVLGSVEHYHVFQEALFRLFPETDE